MPQSTERLRPLAALVAVGLFLVVGTTRKVHLSSRSWTAEDDLVAAAHVFRTTDTAAQECLERESRRKDVSVSLADVVARCAAVASPSAPSGPPPVATIDSAVHPKPAGAGAHLSAYDIFRDEGCLPPSSDCYMCLRKKDSQNKKGNCDRTCKPICGCFCENMCRTEVEERHVGRTVTVRPPPRAATRLIPRIVHQTWFEPVTKEKYPNQSRLVESWKQSGWDYRFYDDDASAAFLSEHFPPEVREAYDTLLPGAFKADLFRYCVLLVQGGVYADMDILLETNLDAMIDTDVGFMVPVDDPGYYLRQTPCLWNGLLAAAPGHPFLARAVEMVVNNVRNRVTTVDFDHLLCPNVNTALTHGYDMLHMAGPCILGAALNSVLGIHKQSGFVHGELDIWKKDRTSEENGGGVPSGVSADDPRRRIPGRSIVLQQNKEDMNAHRFTLYEKNLIVAATDLPHYDDRKVTKEEKEEHPHYTSTHLKKGIYGLTGVFADDVRADEEVRFVVAGEGDGAARRMRG